MKPLSLGLSKLRKNVDKFISLVNTIFLMNSREQPGYGPLRIVVREFLTNYFGLALSHNEYFGNLPALKDTADNLRIIAWKGAVRIFRNRSLHVYRFFVNIGKDPFFLSNEP